jgi:hypothetical protein
MRTIYCVFLIILFSITFSCKNSEAQKIVAEWIGKEIKFPNGIKCFYMGKDTTCPGFIKPYRVLVYIDSIGCSSCKFKLSAWQDLMRDSSFMIFNNVDFLFYFQPKKKEDITFLLKIERFKYPIYLDMKNEINRLNHFPNKIEYQCFLLDSNNKVLMIGNPTLNQKIWELYKEVITDEVATKPLVTTVKLQQTEIEIKDFQLGKTSEAIFILKNAGLQPLFIQRVNTSCGCTVPKWEKHPIASGKNTEIKVKITPEKKGYFDKTITVHCNAEDTPILLRVSGMVKI